MQPTQLYVDSVQPLTSTINTLTLGAPGTDLRVLASNVTSQCDSVTHSIKRVSLQVQESLTIGGNVTIAGSIIMQGPGNSSITLRPHESGGVAIEGGAITFGATSGINLQGAEIKDYIKTLILDSLEDPEYSTVLKTYIENVLREAQSNIEDIEGDNGPSIF